MRRLEQSGQILIRALVISGLVIGMTTIVGIHPVTGSDNCETWFCEGQIAGERDCDKGLKYNPNKHLDSGQSGFIEGYQDGWTGAGCKLP